MIRRKPLSRSSRPARGAKPKARNPKRQAREYARTYHSTTRVLFVKGLPCASCRKSPAEGVDNAHTTGGGMSRKGDYRTIAPLCRHCHAAYDGYDYPFSEPFVREFIARAAVATERAAVDGREQ